MAPLCLINFPEFLNQEILKIGQSEVCVGGGVAKGRIIKLSLSVPNYTKNYIKNGLVQWGSDVLSLEIEKSL